MTSPARPDVPARIGRFEVLARIGSGAFATVYRAHDPALDAAIKVLADNHAGSEDLRRRFASEARAMRRVVSERVVAVHDVGEHEGRPYLVMEEVAGGTLAERLATRDVRRDDLHGLVGQLGAVLAVLHEAGVVHRDVKPSNLLVRPGTPRAGSTTAHGLLEPGEVLVLGDLGLARAAEATALTTGGGTDAWMAPEQRVPTADVDARADLYAASAVVVAAATGQPPGPDALAALPAPLAQAATTGLAHDREGRPPDARAWTRLWSAALVETDASELRSGHRTSAGPLPGSPVHRVAEPSSEEGRELTGAVRRVEPAGRGVRASLASLAVVLAALLVAWIAMRAVDDGDPGVVPPSGDVDNPAGIDDVRIDGPDTVRVGGTATYTHPPLDGVTFTWSLPDGSTSSEQRVELTPGTAGSVRLRLDAVAEDGRTATTTKDVEVVDG